MMQISKALSRFVENHTIAGAVTLVATKDRVLSLEAVGYADLASKRLMTTDAIFWIASMTKPMTAALLMMLVDEGKVSVDDPVEKYLPEFAGQMVIVRGDKQLMVLEPVKRPILVREVLSHTAGLPFMTRVEEQTGKIDLFNLSQAVMGYALTPLMQEASTKYSYSNAGTNTAGRIVEVVSGEPYEQFLQTRLLDPLGMSETTFRPKGELLDRLAKTYKPAEDKIHLEETFTGQLSRPLDNPARTASPAGGLFSTASDVVRFLQMIANGGKLDGRDYLSAESIRMMTTTQTGELSATKENHEVGYGFCWATSKRDPGNTSVALVGGCGHGGALATHMWIEPAEDLITILMIQNAGHPGEDGPNLKPAFEAAARELKRSK